MTNAAEAAAAADCSRPLRLIAIDAEDLAVVSTHVQDALARVGDMAFLRATRRFALVVDRFDWCAAQAGRLARRKTGLHFEDVTRVSCHGVAQRAQDAVLNLLSISFKPTDAPAGLVELTFSGGAAIRLEVECLEAQMRDMGPSWPVDRMPGHEATATGAEP